MLIALGVVLALGLGVGGTLLATGGNSTGGIQTVTREEGTPATDAESPPTATDETTATEAGELGDCDELGINTEEGNEGRCISGGQVVEVVNSDQPVKLRELTVRLVSLEQVTEVSDSLDRSQADGTFVIPTLEVTNNTSRPQEYGNSFSGGEAVLTIANDLFTRDTGAEEDTKGAWYHFESDAVIQPGETKTGSFVFDVPDAAVAKLEERSAAPNLDVVNFSDADRRNPAEVGVVRLWQ